jgi:hypothetical protein
MSARITRQSSSVGGAAWAGGAMASANNTIETNRPMAIDERLRAN